MKRNLTDGQWLKFSPILIAFSPEGSEKLLALAADSLQLLQRAFVLFQFLACLAELALGREALVLIKFLYGLVYQLLDAGGLRRLTG